VGIRTIVRPVTSSIAPRLALLRILYIALTALVCAGLVSAAVLAHAPLPALPLIVVIAIGMPMIAALELPATLTALRRGHREGRALTRLRRELDRLPETHHPLGL
jgi:hypothetical protein